MMEHVRKKTVPVSLNELSSLEIPGTEIHVIRSLIADMSSNHEIEAVFLYGSYVRAEQKPYSDIDIAVITGLSSPPRSLREWIGSYASKNTDVQVFSDLPLNARMQVLSQGIPLYVRHQEFIRGLIRKITTSYMDLEPMRNRWKQRAFRSDI